MKCGPLDFLLPDTTRFPCLDLAYRALRGPGSLPVVLNAANEAAVAAFLAGRLSFLAIAEVIERVMDAHAAGPVATLAEVREADRWARECSHELIQGYN